MLLVDYYLSLCQREMRALANNWPWIFTGVLAVITFGVFTGFILYVITYQGNHETSYRWH
jgi:hypothetical protein